MSVGSRLGARAGNLAQHGGDRNIPMDPIALQQNACEAAQLMKALGNPHRLAILCRLLEGEKSVGQLVALIGLSQSASRSTSRACGATA
jgi:Bacterial regulatory protein, arsR family